MFTVAAVTVATFTVLYVIKHMPSRRRSTASNPGCKNHTCPICNE